MIREEEPIIRRRQKHVIREEEPVVRRGQPQRPKQVIREEDAEYVLQFKGILEETQEESESHSDDELESYMEIINNDVYEEDDYLSDVSDEFSDPEEEYQNILTSIYEENDTEEETYYVKPNRILEKREQKNNNHLDILLFTISGVLMIFIMEQFVQIGMKLKKETVV